MNDLGFLSSLWPLLVELPMKLAWSSVLLDSVDRVDRPLWFRGGEKDGILPLKPKDLGLFAGGVG